MTITVFPGSFDPVALGYVDIAIRARAFAGEVIPAVGFNTSKRHAFDPAQRLTMAKATVEGLDGVRATTLPGLLVDLCKKLGADVVVRGLWGEAGFSAEKPMTLMDRSLTGIGTAFILGDSALTRIASSLIKGVVRHGGDITDLVPPGVAEASVGIHRTKEQQ